jgi:curli biogenesis system outer membrane secretion channel CsgG
MAIMYGFDIATRLMRVLAIAAVGCLICGSAAAMLSGDDTTTEPGKMGTIKGSVEEGDESGLPPIKGPRKTVAVGNFENKTDFRGQFDLGSGFSDMLASALDNADRFIVINRSNIEAILEEQNFAASDRTVASGAASTGKLLSAQFFIIGAVTDYEEVTEGGAGGVRIKGFDVGAKITKAHIAVVLRMIDTTSGEEFTQRVEGSAQTTGIAADYNDKDWGVGGQYFHKTPLGKAVQNAIDQGVILLGTRILNAPWEGKVVMAQPGKIYINAGEREGIKVGDTFVVYHRGEELRDPDTGELLDFVEEKLGTISVITVKEKVSICTEDEIKEGAEIAKGDVLKMQ